MRKVVLFAEDYGHEEFIRPLAARLAREAGVEMRFMSRSVRGGPRKTLVELKDFLDDLDREREALPDLLIVSADADCSRYSRRKKELEGVTGKYRWPVISAIPDPHIEQWLFADPSAFKAILGTRCDAPSQKCSRDKYRELLGQAMRSAGISPPLAGLEFAADLAAAMDLEYAGRADRSLGRFLKELRGKMKQWGETLA